MQQHISLNWNPNKEFQNVMSNGHGKILPLKYRWTFVCAPSVCVCVCVCLNNDNERKNEPKRINEMVRPFAQNLPENPTIQKYETNIKINRRAFIIDALFVFP